MECDPKVEEKFKTMINKLPFLHRKIAQDVVIAKAEELAKARNSQRIEEEDIIKAFILESPNIFKQQMFSLMDEIGFDYKKFL